MPKRIRVAAIQINCELGKIESNLTHAEEMIKRAVQKCAQLVLLPELTPSGYTLTGELWDSAELIDGTSVRWLLRVAKDCGIYLGFSFLEAEGEDFYNSFVLSDPDGKLVGRVRKDPPAGPEAYFYKAGSDAHVIDTAIGRIGVGICYENVLYDQMYFLHKAHVDLVLSPFASPRPKVHLLLGGAKSIEKPLVSSRKIYANTLGVPLVMSNRVGPLETALPGILPYFHGVFSGLSSIVDRDGVVKAELDADEGFIVADVGLGYDPNNVKEPRRYGKMWAVPMPWYSFIYPITQKMGEKNYATNRRRK